MGKDSVRCGGAGGILQPVPSAAGQPSDPPDPDGDPDSALNQPGQEQRGNLRFAGHQNAHSENPRPQPVQKENEQLINNDAQQYILTADLINSETIDPLIGMENISLQSLHQAK